MIQHPICPYAGCNSPEGECLGVCCADSRGHTNFEGEIMSTNNDALLGEKIRKLCNGGQFDLTDSPKSMVDAVVRLCAETALTASKPEPSGEETAWLIELTAGAGAPSWMTDFGGFECFTKEANKAIKFPTKEAAERIFKMCREHATRRNMFGFDRSCYAITEHVFDYTHPQPQPSALPDDVVKDAERYYLQDTRSYVGNCPLWWAVNGHGYTSDLSKAHRYTLREAMLQHKARNTDLPWACNDIDPLQRPTIDMQDMHKLRSNAEQIAAISQGLDALK